MEATTAGRLRVFGALRHRDFRLLWSGQVVSLIGDGAFLTALGWRTFTLAGSRSLGVVLVANALAMLATLLLGGALGDRLPRRTMMIVSDLWRFGAVAALAVLDASGQLTFGVLLALAVTVGLGDGLFYPAFGGIVPLVVDAPTIPSASSLMGMARWGSLFVGPALAGGIYGTTGSATVFAVDAASFLVSAFLLWLARPRPVEPAPREGAAREVIAGIRYVSGVPWLWVTIVLFGLVLMLQLAPQQVLLPKLVHEHFGLGVGAYGALTSAFGFGTIAGTLLFGQLQPRRRRGVLSYWIWLVNSVAIIGMVLSPWYAPALVLAAVRGGLVGFGVAVWETMLMQLVPENLLSRVVSLDYFGSYGLMPVGLAVSAAVSGLAGPGAVIAAGASISAVLFAAFLPQPWLRAVD
jgi:MFS family permease